MEKLKQLLRKEPTFFLLRKIWDLSTGARKQFIAFFVLIFIAHLVVLLEPLIFAEVLNELQDNGLENMGYLVGVLSLFAVLNASFWFFFWMGQVLKETAAFTIRLNYTERFLKGVLDLPLKWHGDRDSGATIDALNKSREALFEFTSSTGRFIRIFVRLVGVCIALLFFNPYVSLLAFSITIVAMVIMWRFDRVLVSQYKRLNIFDNKISASIFDVLSNITTVIILHIQKHALKGVSKELQAPEDLYQKNVKLNQWKWFTGDMAFSLLTVLPIVVYLYHIKAIDGVIEIGTVAALHWYLSMMSSAFFSFAELYGNTFKRKANVDNAKEIEDAIEENRESTEELRVLPKWKQLTISNLNFSYHDENAKEKELHLDDVNITLRRGEKIAFIGESGSGKTTFLKVLHGLYGSSSATLKVDQDKEDILTNFTDINFGTMLVPQEPEIFSSTIRENITLGLPTKSAKVERVMKLARFTDVLEKLPKGLKSVINEKGVNLSGGQKQRLALARALLFARDKQILLLDESTSSVDPENEAKIYEGIFNEFKSQTILASIHKMNLLKYFDRIVMFEKGKIVDEGSFDELLAKNSSFKREWERFVESNK